MALVKFNNRPVAGFNFVDEFLKDMPALFRDDVNAFSWRNSVPVNITETKTGYALEMAVPGFNKEDFKIDLDKNILTISAEKKTEEKKEDEKHVRREFNFSSIKRSFTLNEKIDEEKIEAKYVNGVLTLNLPYKTEVKEPVKQITIQ